MSRSGEIGALSSRAWSEQLALGYGHTLREIGQQPATWPETVATLLSRANDLRSCLDGAHALVLTGSGSSLYAGECAAPALQPLLRRPVVAHSAGQILTHPEICLPPSGPFLLVSLARSGNSPESRAAVDALLRTSLPLTDPELTVMDTLVGQILAFFRCLASGNRPDSPSADRVITRVVSAFEIHGRPDDSLAPIPASPPGGGSA